MSGALDSGQAFRLVSWIACSAARPLRSAGIERGGFGPGRPCWIPTAFAICRSHTDVLAVPALEAESADLASTWRISSR